MDFTQLLLESHEYQESLKDTTIEINQSKLEDGLIINPYKWIESEDLKFFMHGRALDYHMILFTLTQMLSDGELEIKSTNKLQRKNVEYLKMLVEGQSLAPKKEK